MLPILAEPFFRPHSVRLLAPLAAFRALEAALVRRRSPRKLPAHFSLTTAARETSIRLLAPPAAFRALEATSPGPWAFAKKTASAHFSSPRQRAKQVSDCLLRSQRVPRLGSHLVRRRSPRKPPRRSLLLTTAARETSVRLLAPLAAFRALKPPRSSAFAKKNRLGSLLSPRQRAKQVSDCSLRSRKT